ncbi:hypothetical protein AhyVDH1_048 [Aeromonas phage AhyVDH1]|nr:hypothetical protein AhyVDH1_048 [Aeromonas phage AhyVDH1]
MKAIKFKVYQRPRDGRLYRAHPNGKVETSTNGSLWYLIGSLNPSILNQWRRLGIVVKVANRQKVGPDRDELVGHLTRFRDCLMYSEWEHLSQLIPMDDSGAHAYERRDLQTIKVCPTIARGYDGWSSADGLRIVNKGLSKPVAAMVKRRAALERLVSDLEQTVALM